MANKHRGRAWEAEYRQREWDIVVPVNDIGFIEGCEIVGSRYLGAPQLFRELPDARRIHGWFVAQRPQRESQIARVGFGAGPSIQ